MDKIVKIYADWCEPCKRLKKYLESIGIETEDYNIDEPEGVTLAQELGTLTIPVLLYNNDICTSSKPEDVERFLIRNKLK